jgi:sulfate adenylyltransferase
MSSMKTCPHEAKDRVLLSGTKVRKMLSDGEDLPEEFSRPEVAKALLSGNEMWNRQKDVMMDGHG